MKELINANDKYKMNWIEETPSGVRLNALKAFP